MIEVVIVFIFGYICGHYTNQVKSFFVKIINKFKKNTEYENI